MGMMISAFSSTSTYCSIHTMTSWRRLPEDSPIWPPGSLSLFINLIRTPSWGFTAALFMRTERNAIPCHVSEKSWDSWCKGDWWTNRHWRCLGSTGLVLLRWSEGMTHQIEEDIQQRWVGCRSDEDSKAHDCVDRGYCNCHEKGIVMKRWHSTNRIQKGCPSRSLASYFDSQQEMRLRTSSSQHALFCRLSYLTSRTDQKYCMKNQNRSRVTCTYHV